MAEASVGPYRILERLGAGANGEVFLAEDTRLHRRVALKRLFDRGGTDPAESRRKLLREARAAARLNHPHIAAVHDVLETPDGVHIVMEYVPGTTLATRVRTGPLPPMQVLDYALQLSGALAHAHELGVIHRDLKPGNVMVTDHGQCKILDFGLARVNEVAVGSVALSGDDSTEGRHLVGTPPYMPPEHLRGAPVDACGDIYSLGVTLFELLTGRRPFDLQSGMPPVEAILSAPTPRPRSLAPDVPKELDDLVFRAMARIPAERFGTATRLHSALQDLGHATTDPPTRSRAIASRSGALRLSALAAAGVILTAMGVWLYGFGGREWIVPGDRSGLSLGGPPVVAVLPLSGHIDGPDAESLATGLADSLITALSKTRGLAVVSRAATLKYRDRTQDPDAIARELGATVLVDGALHDSPDTGPRVTFALLQRGSKVVHWQNSYPAKFSEAFTIEHEVTNALAAALELPSAARSAQPTSSVEAFADYAQARTFLERPDIKAHTDSAIGLFRSAIARDPRFASAHAGLGQAYWQKYQGTRDERWSIDARDAINEALRLDPEDTSVRYALASIYQEMGLVTKAIDELRRIAADNPGADDAHRLLGQLLAQTGRRQEGIASILRAVALRPSYWNHHYTLGHAYYSGGAYGEAVSTFGRVTELQPDNSWGHLMLGASHHARNQIKEAIRSYQRAIDLGNEAAYSNLGTIYARQGRPVEAERCYKEAIRRSPTAQKHHNLGDLYAMVGRRNEALAAYRNAAKLAHDQLRVRPRDVGALMALAVVEAKLGRVESARARADEAMAIAPEAPEPQFTAAIVACFAGDADRAFAALRRAVERGYNRERAADDRDLSPLKSDPRFAEILTLRTTTTLR